ncbi:MAG: TIGR02996 domain-containing protein [Myxococcaceae bacterium]
MPLDAKTLQQLIAAWQRTRHPRLAELAEVLDAKLLTEAAREPLKASKKKDDLATWVRLEQQHDPLDFSRLAAAARGGTQDDVARQVAVLAAWDDPRMGSAMLTLLEDPPYAGVRSRELLQSIVGILEATRDVRLAPRARDLAGRYLGIVNSGTGGWMVTQLTQLAERLEKLAPSALDASAEALCTELEPALGGALGDRRRDRSDHQEAGRSLEALFAAVYDAPDDDAPRLVLADALLAQNDPRGELIILQVARANGQQTAEQAAREKELLSDEDRLAAWAQPLSNGGRCRFGRGFPEAVELYRAGKGIIKERAWVTVRQVSNLEQLAQKTAAELLLQPACASLRSAGRVAAGTLKRLTGERRWTALVLDGLEDLEHDDLQRTPHLERLEASFGPGVKPGLLAPLTRLKRLELYDTADATPFAGALLTAQPLDQLRLELHFTPVTELPLPPSLERLELLLREGTLPRGALNPLTKLTQLQLTVKRIDRGALDGLRALESLKLSTTTVEAGAFEALGGLKSLELSFDHGATIPKQLLAPLRSLRTLDAQWATVLSGEQLSGLERLEVLKRRRLKLDELPELPSLRQAHLTAPKTLEELSRFFTRFAPLQVLDFESYSSAFDHSPLAKPEPGERERAYERLAELLAASKLQRFSFDDAVVFERDAKGEFSKSTAGRATGSNAGAIANRLEVALKKRLRS